MFAQLENYLYILGLMLTYLYLEGEARCNFVILLYLAP